MSRRLPIKTLYCPYCEAETETHELPSSDERNNNYRLEYKGTNFVVHISFHRCMRCGGEFEYSTTTKKLPGPE